MLTYVRLHKPMYTLISLSYVFLFDIAIHQHAIVSQVLVSVFNLKVKYGGQYCKTKTHNV